MKIFTDRFLSSELPSLFLKIVIYFAFLTWAANYSLGIALNAPTFHLDGAFQTASGLFRLNFGHLPGRDFYPYLGIGPLLVLFPAFKILGSDLSASVFSAQFMTLTLGALTVSIVFHLIFLPKSIFTSLATGSVFFITPLIASLNFSFDLYPIFGFAIDPGNSLRPIRAALPYLAVVIFFAFSNDQKINPTSHIKNGFLTALILLWSNDFAIPTLIVFGSFFILRSMAKEGVRFRALWAYCISAVLFFLLFLVVVSFGNPIKFLTYNFVDLPKEQWWLFGPYADSARVFTPTDAYRIISAELFLPLTVLALVYFQAYKSKRIESVLLANIGLSLFCGGVLASIGGHIGGYFGGFVFWGTITSAALTLKLISVGLQALVKDRQMYGRFAILILLSITSFIAINLSIDSNRKYDVSVLNASRDSERFFVPELGAFLGVVWREYIEIVRQSKDSHVVEEYWGLWSATQKEFKSTWPVDSVIHAFGRTKETLVASIEAADRIVSTRHLASPEWQSWNLSQNFWFYDKLLTSWTPYKVSPTTIIWRKNDKLQSFPKIPCLLGADNKSVKLESLGPGFYRLELDYNLASGNRHLLMVRNNISIGSDSEGYVSIDPNGSKAVFPAYVSKSGVNVLDIKISGRGYPNLRINSCSASQITFFDDEVLHVPGSINPNFFVTDHNWIHGVARKWSGFFVPSNPQFSEPYKIARAVRFPNGDTRMIVRTEQVGPYLNVYVDGPVLDPEKVGLPSNFKVVP